MTQAGVPLALGLAGALGAVVRFVLVEAIGRRWTGRFPLATFLINVSGSFALSVVLASGTAHAQALEPYRLILGTGFLGGYTTFSALSVETHMLARNGKAHIALGYGVGSLVAGVVAFVLGGALATLL